MANRRCFHALTCCLQSITTLPPLSQALLRSSSHALNQALITTTPHYIFVHNFHACQRATVLTRNFSSKLTDNGDGDEDDDDDESDYLEYDESEEEEEENENKKESVVLSADDKEKEATEIGYKVIGPLQKSEQVFKPYEPVFAVVQIGSHQFKVSNEDTIFTERLKFCDVNDKDIQAITDSSNTVSFVFAPRACNKAAHIIAHGIRINSAVLLILNKVLMIGSPTQTIIGRPVLPNAAVRAVVEEHALDAKVIIFKKKRRKNYRRKNGHRQELTRLRITDIQGIEKPVGTAAPTKEKAKREKVAIGA